MTTVVVVKNKDELKAALNGDATEIIVEDAKLVGQLRAIKLLRRAGPFVVAGVIASIALIPATGGTSAIASTAFFAGGGSAGAGASGLGIAALCVAIGGTVVIGIFTDWEEVDMAGVFKLKRKAKKSKAKRK